MCKLPGVLPMPLTVVMRDSDTDTVKHHITQSSVLG